MTHSDLIQMLDKKYSSDSDRVLCPNQGKLIMLPQSKVTTSDHGHLGVHASGNDIVCGVCGYKQPVARI